MKHEKPTVQMKATQVERTTLQQISRSLNIRIHLSIGKLTANLTNLRLLESFKTLRWSRMGKIRHPSCRVQVGRAMKDTCLSLSCGSSTTRSRKPRRRGAAAERRWAASCHPCKCPPARQRRTSTSLLLVRRPSHIDQSAGMAQLLSLKTSSRLATSFFRKVQTR